MTEQNTTATTDAAPAASSGRLLRTALIGLIVVLVFVASYQIAGAGGRNEAGIAAGSVPGTVGQAQPAVAGGFGADGSAGCACCANSGTGEVIEGTATIDGDVQRISIDATNGYEPNVIRLAPGIPAEITFSQASGCMAQVMSAELDFFEDLTGGPRTISLPALEPGSYGFSCGMEMVFGEIIVE